MRPTPPRVTLGRMRRTITLLCGTAASVLALAACGSSSGLSKSQLAAKVDPICTSLVTQVKTIPVPTDFVQNPAHAATYLGRLITVVENGYNQVSALKPAGSVKAQFDSYSQAIQHELTLLKKAESAAKAKDPSGPQTLNQESQYNSSVVKPDAKALGFTSCT